MRFQITLEGKGFVFLFESAVELDLSRTEFGRMRAATLVVCEEPLFEVLSEPDIGLVRLVYTSDDVDIEHSPCSVSLRSLLRFCNQLRRAGFAKSRQNPHLRLFPWPATRSPQGEAWRRRELNPRPWQTNQPRLHA